jgi:hypothetical protein
MQSFCITRKSAAQRIVKNLCILRKAFLLMLIAAMLISCATQKSLRTDFEENLKNYHELIRWRQLDEASLLASGSVSRAFKERLQAAKNTVVVDYRISNISYSEKTREASVKVEIDYYSLSSYRIRTVTDNQKWVYEGKEGRGAWRLISLFPEFP